jgi:hypothetical protein
MRYGPKRIAAVIGIIAILVLSSFMVKNYIERQNAYVLSEIIDKTIELAGNEKVEMGEKFNILAEAFKGGNITLEQVANAVDSDIDKIDLLSNFGSIMTIRGNYEPRELILGSLSYADSLLNIFTVGAENEALAGRILNESNNLRVALEMAYYYNPGNVFYNLLESNADRSARWVLYLIENQPAGFADISELNLAMENALNYAKLSQDDIEKILQILSPFENQNRKDWVLDHFQKDRLLVRGSQSYGFKFNGLYHELAHLYAAIGHVQKTLSCIDSLMTYSENYYGNRYSSNVDNATNIAVTFYLNGRENQMNEFVDGYCRKAGISTIDFFKFLLGNSVVCEYFPGSVDFFTFANIKINLNLQASKGDQKDFFYERYRQEVSRKSKSENEKNFLLALSFKNQGVQSLHQMEMQGRSIEEEMRGRYFGKAIQLYSKVDPSYLGENTSLTLSSNEEFLTTKNYLFAYPDLLLENKPMEPRSFSFYYSSGVFIDYIIENDLFDNLYTTDLQLKSFESWFRDYMNSWWAKFFFFREPLHFNTLKRIEEKLAARGVGDFSDLNLLYLFLSKEYAALNDRDGFLYCHSKLNANNINNSFNFTAFGFQVNNNSFYLFAKHIANLAEFGETGEVVKLINSIGTPTNRSTLYSFVAKELTYRDPANQFIQSCIDSAYAEIMKIDNLTGQPNRIMLAFAHAMQNNEIELEKAKKAIKNVPFKFIGYQHISQSYGYHQSLFKAMNMIPKNISDNDMAIFLWNILYGNNVKSGNFSDNWDNFNQNYCWGQTRWIVYRNDNG